MRTAVIAAANAIAAAAAMEVATAMVMASDTARWWFRGGSGSGGNSNDSG